MPAAGSLPGRGRVVSRRRRVPAQASSERPGPAEVGTVTRLESDYYSYMEFDPEHTREVLRHYVPMFEDKSPVLELGCGRGEFVAVTPNPACYAVLSHDFWRDPTHVRFYDLPLLEFLCRQAGLEVEATGTNPANHPGPPPEYLGPEPVVHPPLDDLVERAMGKLRASLDHRDRKGRVTEHHHDPEWAYELAHVVRALAGRLQETTEALREIRRAHDKLVWGLYQSNETYVVARG